MRFGKANPTKNLIKVLVGLTYSESAMLWGAEKAR
jgi:hypothetical protein